MAQPASRPSACPPCPHIPPPACAHSPPLNHQPPLPPCLTLLQYFVNNASALFFTWTVKAGVILGVSAGQGFVVKQLGGGKWGAPCFVKIAAAQAGAIVGVEKVRWRHFWK